MHQSAGKLCNYLDTARTRKSARFWQSAKTGWADSWKQWVRCRWRVYRWAYCQWRMYWTCWWAIFKCLGVQNRRPDRPCQRESSPARLWQQIKPQIRGGGGYLHTSSRFYWPRLSWRTWASNASGIWREATQSWLWVSNRERAGQWCGCSPLGRAATAILFTARKSKWPYQTQLRKARHPRQLQNRAAPIWFGGYRATAHSKSTRGRAELVSWKAKSYWSKDLPTSQ